MRKLAPPAWHCGLRRGGHSSLITGAAFSLLARPWPAGVSTMYPRSSSTHYTQATCQSAVLHERVGAFAPDFDPGI